jgi:hypothetical protein
MRHFRLLKGQIGARISRKFGLSVEDVGGDASATHGFHPAFERIQSTAATAEMEWRERAPSDPRSYPDADGAILVSSNDDLGVGARRAHADERE